MNSPPRLAILTLDFLPHRGGLQEYLYEIAQQLTVSIDVTVVTPVSGALPEDSSFRRILAPSSSPFELRSLLRDLDPDVLLLGHAHPRLLLAGRLWGKYATLTHGNDFIAAQGRWHSPLFNQLLRGSRPLIANSQGMGIRLVELGMPAPRIVKPGTDPERFFPAQTPPAVPTLLTVARLVSRKGIDTVLRALPGLLVNFPNLRYQIAGQGPDQAKLEQLAEELGVGQAVEFLGFVPDNELPDLYRSASIFVMPSREEHTAASVEGFGIVYLEASASALPVVAARSGGVTEAVQDNVTGLMVPPDDPVQLTGALRRLLQDPELRRRLGKNGRQWVIDEMNWERAAKELWAAIFNQ